MTKVIELNSKIIVSKVIAEAMQDILNTEEGHYEGAGRDSVIETFSTKVSDGTNHFGVDIKVCNGDTPYVDPVLFEVEKVEGGTDVWSEIYPLDVEEELLGEYEFETEKDGISFVITVEVLSEENATAEDIDKYGVRK